MFHPPQESPSYPKPEKSPISKDMLGAVRPANGPCATNKHKKPFPYLFWKEHSNPVLRNVNIYAYLIESFQGICRLAYASYVASGMQSWQRFAVCMICVNHDHSAASPRGRSRNLPRVITFSKERTFPPLPDSMSVYAVCHANAFDNSRKREGLVYPVLPQTHIANLHIFATPTSAKDNRQRSQKVKNTEKLQCDTSNQHNILP